MIEAQLTFKIFHFCCSQDLAADDTTSASDTIVILVSQARPWLRAQSLSEVKKDLVRCSPLKREAKGPP